jgi:pyridoxine kinase
MARILAISSHVARGHVGLAANVAALQWLGHEVWPVPTVLLASRPGLGSFVRRDVPAQDLHAMLSALEADGCWTTLDAVLTGYFPSAEAVAAAAGALRRIRRANPQALVLVDPILGDGGRLYIAEPAAIAIRDQLMPLADIATPNLFELQWLTGRTPASLDEVANAAGALGRPHVVVTSATTSAEEIATLLIGTLAPLERRLRWRNGIPNGAGDVFAGLLLGYLLRDLSPPAALDASLAALDRVLGASIGRDVLQLSALTAAVP